MNELGVSCPICKASKETDEYICDKCWSAVPIDQKMLWKLSDHALRMKMVQRWSDSGDWHKPVPRSENQ